ncbi:MAG: hypothetical protein MUD01_06325 [Chloroflexaceae bacterium]|nr:hypothetical protein [Chloroflexaceae bacterium]
MLLIAGCSFIPGSTQPRRAPQTITQAEAEALLIKAQEYAKAQDTVKLCELNGFPQTSPTSLCMDHINMRGGLAGIPSDPPRIVDTFVMDDIRHANGTMTSGGRVLVVEGVDGLGKSYRSEFFVTPATEPGPLGNWLRVPFPVYWSGVRVSGGNPRAGPGNSIREEVPAVAPTATP